MEMRKIEKKLAFDVEAQKSSYDCLHDCYSYSYQIGNTATDYYNYENGWGGKASCKNYRVYDAAWTTKF